MVFPACSYNTTDNRPGTDRGKPHSLMHRDTVGSSPVTVFGSLLPAHSGGVQAVHHPTRPTGPQALRALRARMRNAMRRCWHC
mmetsp:Transcript_33302/g.53722  ORF Transcript_33302/g.53722 Transcript_33302/m.53722 type:complete len:83 (+) Transcript_33302:3208-3456(+)